MNNMNHRPYYEEGRKISPFDVVEDWDLDFFLGNVVKYIGRLWRKPDVELSPAEKALQDCDKAIVYLTKEREKIAKQVAKERAQDQPELKFD